MRLAVNDQATAGSLRRLPAPTEVGYQRLKPAVHLRGQGLADYRAGQRSRAFQIAELGAVWKPRLLQMPNTKIPRGCGASVPLVTKKQILFLAPCGARMRQT